MERLTGNYISSSEAARILGIHPFGVQNLIRSGRLSAEKIANRWIVSRTLVEEFAKSYEGRRGRPRKKRKYTRRVQQ